MENYNNDQLSSIDLQVDNEVRQELTESAKWAKFISIVMFVAAGLILLFGVLGGSLIMGVLGKMGNGLGAMVEYGGGILIAIVLVVVIFFTVVYYFLYRFSTKIKSAILTENVIDMKEAFSSLKLFFIISTVVSIFTLLISIYNMFKTF